LGPSFQVTSCWYESSAFCALKVATTELPPAATNSGIDDGKSTAIVVPLRQSLAPLSPEAADQVWPSVTPWMIAFLSAPISLVPLS